MSSSLITSIRIVSLPMEFQTQDSVVDFVENVLQLGSVASVSLVENTTATNVRYVSAFVDFADQADSENACHVFSSLEADNTMSVKLECSVPIHWNNGKEMGYVSIRGSKIGFGVARNENVTASQLALEVDSWMSIYIPMIPDNMLVDVGGRYTTFGANELQNCIENKLRLGKVKRVDFVTRQIEDRTVQAAFVHFDYWFDLPYANKVRDTMNSGGFYRQKGVIENGQFCSFVAIENGDVVNRYLTFKINHKPIPDATPEMNIEQIAAANSLLSKALEEKEARIAELEARLSREEGELDGKGVMSVAELA